MTDACPLPVGCRHSVTGSVCQSMSTPCSGAMPSRSGPRKSGQSAVVDFPLRRKSLASALCVESTLSFPFPFQFKEGVIPPLHSILTQPDSSTEEQTVAALINRVGSSISSLFFKRFFNGFAEFTRRWRRQGTESVNRIAVPPDQDFSEVPFYVPFRLGVFAD